MSADKIMADMKAKMTGRIGHFHTELSKIRTGRVHPTLVEHIKVEAYDSVMPLNQVATISVPDPKCLAIQPWDKTLIEAVEKSLLKADIGVTPANDGNVIRLHFPPLSEERRKDLVKNIKHMSEEAKVACRHMRKEAMVELQKHKKEMSEDDLKRLEDTIQKELTAQEKKINDTTELKAAELMKF